MTGTQAKRGAWNSKLGFVLAASGSAIGLGNIVFFTSNAYQYGGGAFYLPYFVALFTLGIPVMILELGLGTLTGRSFPNALRQVGGRRAEMLGWWAIAAQFIITAYYVVIIAWAVSMMVGSLGNLFRPGVSAPFDPFRVPSTRPSAVTYFFHLVSTGWPLVALAAVWAINLFALRGGARTIEAMVRVFVPLMWVFMIGLIIRGLTLDGGLDGVLYLFTPAPEGIANAAVWRGAFAQMFFSLSLGLGVMTTYASYLPKKADQVANAFTISFLNCGFEYIAGVAIFALLFVFSLNPAGTTLSLSFFVVPQGIAAFPWGVRFFGFLFFLLVTAAGLTSSVSLIEGMVSAIIDKFGLSRGRALLVVSIPCALVSCLFVLPQIVDPGLAGNGTLGLTLLDLVDHWVFSYALITVGFVETLILGWVLGADKLRAAVNEHSRIPLGRWYEPFIRWGAPALLGVILVWSLAGEFTGETLYGGSTTPAGLKWLTVFIPLACLAGTVLVATILTRAAGKADEAPAGRGGAGGAAATLGAVALLVSGALLAPAKAHAQDVPAIPARARVGEAVNLTLPGAASLTVTYRPNSSIARSVTLPVGSDGVVVWTPEQAGVVALVIDGGTSRNVSVRFAGVPWLGIVVLAAAGTILFGGAGYGLKRLFEGDDHAFPLDT
jgi:NSS family neurotransmitter:Na+ symporter